MPETLDIKQVAKIFKVHDRTVLRMIHRGELTAARVGRQWRFEKTYILDFVKGESKSRKAA